MHLRPSVIALLTALLLMAGPNLVPSSKAAGTNLVQNWSFETSGSRWLSPWILAQQSGAAGNISQDKTTHVDGNYSARVNVTQRSSTPSALQLYQGGLTYSAGQAYTLSFWARAATQRTLAVTIQQAVAPTSTRLTQSVTVGTSWQQYSVAFTPLVSETGTLAFNLAQSTGKIWLDAVSLAPGASSPATTTPTADPTATATLTPTATATMTATSTITPTPEPTDTPVPTDTPAPTDTVIPTYTSTPTDTPVTTSTPTPTDTPAATATATSSTGVYLGVWQPDPAYPTSDYNLTALKKFEADAQHHMAIVHFWRDWASDKGTIDSQLLAAIAQHGSVPLITWNPTNYASGSSQTPYCLSNILNGGQNAYIDQTARGLAAYGGPVLIRTMHEMNGTWYKNWSPGQTDACGQLVTASEYINAWRYIHDRFVADGATNVQWVWCPNTYWSGSVATNPTADYPGDAYVDWIGVDGYNMNSTGWGSFAQVFGTSYPTLAGLSSKPLMIVETASGEANSTQAAAGYSKAQWISDAFTQAIPSMPRIRAVLWFNQTDGSYNYPIESSTASQNAYAQAVQAPMYLGTWP